VRVNVNLRELGGGWSSRKEKIFCRRHRRPR
jgi:hypothetical protein